MFQSNKKINTPSKQFQNLTVRGESIPLKHIQCIHDRLFSWLGTGTNKKWQCLTIFMGRPP